MATSAGPQSFTYPENLAVLTSSDAKFKTVTVDSGNVDSGSTPTSLLREGNVLVKRTSTGRYVEGNDSNGDANTQASVSASETADADWQDATVTINVDGVDIVTVTLASDDDTDSEVADALNANAIFAANCIADVSSSRVRIRTLRAGADVSLKVTSSLSTAFGASGTTDSGEYADFVVLAKPTHLIDEAGSAAHSSASVVYSGGRLREANLINLTPEGKRALLAKGFTFE